MASPTSAPRLLRPTATSLLRTTVVLVGLLGPGAPGATAQLGGVMEDLGTLGGAGSEAEDTSADGDVVVGRARAASGAWRAFWWTSATGCVDLGTLGGAESHAYAVSAAGDVVVGESTRALGDPHAFLWTATGGMQGLGTLDVARSVANDVSADGAVVVGVVGLGYGVRRRAFRWTAAGGIEDLGTLGGAWSGARGVSADGLVVVGDSETANGELHAFRWTAAGGMQDLGALAPGAASSAVSASADGAVVVGYGDIGVPLYHALRWVGGSLTDLGTLGSSVTTVHAVSADGALVVGGGLVPAFGHQGRAFRWTAGSGFELLGTLGGSESWARGVSGDGATIVGISSLANGDVHAFRWRGSAASVTCTQSAQGPCAASVEALGTASLTATTPFWIRLRALPSGSFVSLAYGVGASVALPGVYGTLCVPGPGTRLAVLGAGGSAALGPCEGAVALDFNTFLSTSGDPALVAGAHLVVQALYRDGAASGGAALSAAIEFDLAP